LRPRQQRSQSSGFCRTRLNYYWQDPIFPGATASVAEPMTAAPPGNAI
jgi:hypothetical protein